MLRYVCVYAFLAVGFGGGGVWQLPSTHALGTRYLGWVPVVVEGYTTGMTSQQKTHTSSWKCIQFTGRGGVLYVVQVPSTHEQQQLKEQQQQRARTSD